MTIGGSYWVYSKCPPVCGAWIPSIHLLLLCPWTGSWGGVGAYPSWQCAKAGYALDKLPVCRALINACVYSSEAGEPVALLSSLLQRSVCCGYRVGSEALEHWFHKQVRWAECWSRLYCTLQLFVIVPLAAVHGSLCFDTEIKLSELSQHLVASLLRAARVFFIMCTAE